MSRPMNGICSMYPTDKGEKSNVSDGWFRGEAKGSNLGTVKLRYIKSRYNESRGLTNQP